jgi:hypothetical protein
MRRLVISLALVVVAACGPTIGDPCTTATDCGAAVCLTRDFTPGGYCSASCVVNTDNSCPTGSTCVKDALGQGVPGCLRTCQTAASCRGGYQCKGANGSNPVCIGPQGI